MSYNTEKTARQADVKALAEKVKSGYVLNTTYRDDKEVSDARIKALEQMGGESNVIDTIKVNGTVLIVNDKTVNIGVPTKTSQLSNDSEYQSKAEVQTLIESAIASTGHASFKVADSIPTVDEAEDNVMYLVMNDKSGHYDIYAKVENEVVLIDDTVTDMDDYIKDLSISGAVITYTKGDNSTYTITIPNMSGATTSTIGSAGLVPAPSSGQQELFLRGDGTWANPTSVSGIVEEAEKATKDSAEQVITATYIKDLSVDGTTVTYTKGDGTTGTIITQDNDTTYSDMSGATSSAAGASGLVPAPSSGQQEMFLRGDGTWNTPAVADTATKLATAHTLTIGNTGKTFDGSEDVTWSLSDIGATGVTKTSELTNDSDYQTGSQVTKAIDTAISNSGHASYKKVDSVPDVADAETNVLYLVMNSETSHYDIYALVDNEMVLLDDTTVDLSEYIKGLSASGTTLTYTKGDGTTGTVTTKDTTYSAATTSTAGLMSASDKSKLDGITASADSVSVAQSLTSGTQVGTITVNGTATKLYAPTNTDTKVTNTLATTTKAYVTGTTSATTNTGTQVFDTGVYLDTTAGQIAATTFKGALSGNATTATSLQVHSDRITLEAASIAGSPSANAPTGLNLYKTYNDSNSPTKYGNVLTACGSGAGQLLLGWSGTDNTTERLYYRSHRDTSSGGYGPWKKVAYTDDVTTYSAATTSAAGLMSASDKSKLDGITSSADSVSVAQSLTSGTQVGTITVNGTATKLYAPTNTDTKVTSTLATTTKAYVTGTTSATTNTGTQVFDTGVYLDTTAGQLTATTFKGALSGNASTATKLATARTIALSGDVTGSTSFDGSGNATASVTRRGAFVGQNSSTPTNVYYKVASVSISEHYGDRNITFYVHKSWSSVHPATHSGILTINLRTDGSGYSESCACHWLVAGSGIDVSKFILAHNTSTSPAVAELWCKVDEAYSGWAFDVIGENTRLARSNSLWTLYNTFTAGSQSAITSGYTQVVSSLVTLKNTAQSANTFSFTSSVSSLKVTSDDWYSFSCDTKGSSYRPNFVFLIQESYMVGAYDTIYYNGSSPGIFHSVFVPGWKPNDVYTHSLWNETITGLNASGESKTFSNTHIYWSGNTLNVYGGNIATLLGGSNNYGLLTCYEYYINGGVSVS